MNFGPMYRNVILLAVCQALFFSVAAMNITVASLVGHALVADKSLATLPVTMSVVGAMLSTMPMALFMQRRGRRMGFAVGALAGMAGMALCALAIAVQSFALFLAGVTLFGLFVATAAFFRFAAAELADDAFRPRAISWVMIGSLFAGLVGPKLATLTQNLLSAPFMASYLAAILLCALVLILQSVISYAPPATSRADEAAPRGLGALVAQPAFFAALVAGMVGYASMSYLMTATPLSMVHHHGHDFASAGFVIQAHVIAMFAPSFFTGGLIARWGAPRIILAGVLANMAAVATALSGVGFLHFMISLVLLGVGWNFMYVGGTAWLTQSYRPSERGRAQGFNDLMVSGFTALASYASGLVLHHTGWSILAWSAVPFLILAGAVVAWAARRTRRQAARFA